MKNYGRMPIVKDWNTTIPLYTKQMKKLTSGDSQPLKAAALQLTFFEAISKNKPEILYDEIISNR